MEKRGIVRMPCGNDTDENEKCRNSLYQQRKIIRTKVGKREIVRMPCGNDTDENEKNVE